MLYYVLVITVGLALCAHYRRRAKAAEAKLAAFRARTIKLLEGVDQLIGESERRSAHLEGLQQRTAAVSEQLLEATDRLLIEYNKQLPAIRQYNELRKLRFQFGDN